MNDNQLSVIGIFFTLVGLMGTYFYIHLGSWYAEVVSLNSKYEISKTEGWQQQQEMQRSIRYEYKKIFTFVPFLTTSVNTLFTLIVSVFSFNIICENLEDQLVVYLGSALLIFLIIYFVLIAFFLISGLIYKNKMRNLFD